MLGLKIFVRVQTFRQAPLARLRNSCHPVLKNHFPDQIENDSKRFPKSSQCNTTIKVDVIVLPRCRSFIEKASVEKQMVRGQLPAASQLIPGCICRLHRLSSSALFQKEALLQFSQELTYPRQDWEKSVKKLPGLRAGCLR